MEEKPCKTCGKNNKKPKEKILVVDVNNQNSQQINDYKESSPKFQSPKVLSPIK